MVANGCIRDSMNRQQARALGLTRFDGKECPKHLGLRERYTSTGNCTRCQSESMRAWRLANPEAYRTRKSSAKYLAKRRELYRIDRSRRARVAARDALKLRAIPIGADVQEINRAFAELSRQANALGMTIDHIVPLVPCRVCGAKGDHVLSNWQILSLSDNSSKCNRCHDCWIQLRHRGKSAPPTPAR
jgi:hypothetical protein